MCYDQIIEKAIRISKGKTFPPEFIEEEGRGNRYNCYAHVLLMDEANFKYSVTLGHIIQEEFCEIMPGFLSGPVDVEDTSVYQELCSLKILERIKGDLNLLGRTLSESDGTIIEGTYNIMVYVDEEFGPHFIRQNRDGSWSEKPGFNEYHFAQRTSPSMQDIESTCLGVFRISNTKE